MKESPCAFIGCKSNEAHYAETWLNFGKGLEPCSAYLCREHGVLLSRNDVDAIKNITWTKGGRIDKHLSGLGGK